MLRFTYLLLAFPLLAFAAEEPKLIAFEKVSEGVYRGGRPRNQTEMNVLRTRGIKTVINLQGYVYKVIPGESKHSIQAAAKWAQKAGMNFFNSPIYTIRRVSRQDDATILAVAKIMNDPQMQPVYVHCNVGADRTGIVVASYRMLYQGCSFLQVKEELLDHGKVWTPLFTAKQMRYLNGLAARQKTLTGPLKQKCPLAELE